MIAFSGCQASGARFVATSKPKMRTGSQFAVRDPFHSAAWRFPPSLHPPEVGGLIGSGWLPSFAQDAGNRARVLAQLCPEWQLCGPLRVSFYQSRYSFKGIVAQEGHVTLLPRWGRRWINLIFGFCYPPLGCRSFAMAGHNQ